MALPIGIAYAPLVVGVLPGILVAVGLALLRLLRLASHPPDAVLGLVEGKEDAYGTGGEGGRMIPGLLIYRFDASLVFFNADYFKDRVLALCNEAGTPKWLLLDAESIPFLDITGAGAVDALRNELAGRGTVLAIARATKDCSTPCSSGPASPEKSGRRTSSPRFMPACRPSWTPRAPSAPATKIQ